MPTPSTDNSSAPTAPGEWQGEVKRIEDLAPSETAMWQQLTASCDELRSPFFSLEFSQAVAEAGARARVCLLYENGELAGLFPFQFSSGFSELMAAGERIGGALNDFCGVVIDRARHGAIGAQDLLNCAGLASFEVSHLEEMQRELGLSKGVPSKGARVRLEGGMQHYWESVKTGHRSAYDTLHNRERKVEREFRPVDFVFAHAEPGELANLVVDEKRKQYERTAAQDGFVDPWKVRCLKRIAQYKEGGCVPVLSTLYFNGEWAAFHFGVQAGTVLHYWFPVYNPRFAGLSPGLILLARVIREAANRGIGEIDLGEGMSRYKELFATETYSVYRDVWYRASPRGLAYRGYLSLSWRARSMLQQRSQASQSDGR